MNTRIYPVTAFRDNYIWLFHNSDSAKAVVVDPGDDKPVKAALQRFGLSLETVLLTHHHLDHTGGLEALCGTNSVRVIGPATERFPLVTNPVKEGDRILAGGLEFEVFEVPGHTSDHIAYYANPEREAPLLFCGDTLFTAGCGRLFEGSAEQMYHSLEKLSKLPDETRVYCAHEYTLDNLAFAMEVEPDSPSLGRRKQRVLELRNRDIPAVPSTIGEEKETNPFLRCHLRSVMENASRRQARTLTSPVEVFATIRRWKDTF